MSELPAPALALLCASPTLNRFSRGQSVMTSQMGGLLPTLVAQARPHLDPDDALAGGLSEQSLRPERGREVLAIALSDAGLPAGLAAAYDDEGWDVTIQADTDEALALTGKDVGTPILHIAPPEGAAFFGPVISRVPSDEDALRLWDHVVGLATFPGFAEMKRSLRELPQLRALGVAEDEVGRTEDWHGGSRRLKK